MQVLWTIENEKEILNKLHRIVTGISSKRPKYDPTNFEFKVHCTFPLRNCQPVSSSFAQDWGECFKCS